MKELSCKSEGRAGGVFDFALRTRLVAGRGTVQRVGEIVRGVGGKRVLLVTDQGIAKAGHLDLVRGLLESVGLEVFVYDTVRQNPDTKDVAGCVKVGLQGQVDTIVGLGGGSSMDTAKGANFLMTNGGEMKDYWGVGKAMREMLPFVAVPTTSGTGSECQSFALITDPETHQKMACGDIKAMAAVAILDPELTMSQPFQVTACTGIDALAHALETAVTTRRNAVSLLFSREAFRLCLRALPVVLNEPQDLEARGDMQLGAAYAGLAIENSMLGCAHAAANPLTARYGLVHGRAVGRMLPAVIRRNAKDPDVALLYDEHSKFAGLDGIDELLERVESVLEAAKLNDRLSSFGLQESDLRALAEEAHRQWTSGFNPVTYKVEDFEALYREVL